MAFGNRVVGGLGGAAQGYALGGPIGAGIGGLAGLIFGGGSDPQMPQIEINPDLLKSLQFSDVSLQDINPALYEQIMNNMGAAKAAQQILSARGDGNSPQARRQMNEDAQQSTERLAGMGLAGTPIGEAMMGDTMARLRDANQARAMQEQMQKIGMMNQINSGTYDMTRGALADQLNQANVNRNMLLNIDQLKNGYAMNKYNDDLQNSTARNQFWSGMFNSGVGNIGQMQNAAMMRDLYGRSFPGAQPSGGLSSWGGIF